MLNCLTKITHASIRIKQTRGTRTHIHSRKKKLVYTHSNKHTIIFCISYVILHHLPLIILSCLIISSSFFFFFHFFCFSSPLSIFFTTKNIKISLFLHWVLPIYHLPQLLKVNFLYMHHLPSEQYQHYNLYPC